MTSIEPPKNIKKLLIQENISDYITKQIAEWIVVFMREGKFYLSEDEKESIRIFDLEKVSDRATGILEDFFLKHIHK